MSAIDTTAPPAIEDTKPFLPPIDEYCRYLADAWGRERVTNDGPLVQQLERELAGYLGLPDLLFVSSGTMALQLALRSLRLKGEVITTPFSHIATASAITWQHCTPVFVDIDERTLNIDSSAIESAITPRTRAILASHVFGNPCDVDRIQAVAEAYGLWVVYDGAHAFGTTYKGRPVFACGDVSTMSFHARRVFHTVEGGGIFAEDDELLARLRSLRHFGPDDGEDEPEFGINGNNSELHAAVGLANLKYATGLLDTRRRQSVLYHELLAGLPVRFQERTAGADVNCSHLPVIFEDARALIRVMAALAGIDVRARRYFSPSLNTLFERGGPSMPVSERIASRVLCLPLFHSLRATDIERICCTIRRAIGARPTGHRRPSGLRQVHHIARGIQVVR